jgi:HD-like signal output (HDOD) protein
MPTPVLAATPAPATVTLPESLLKALAAELAAGELKLPSFPDVAQRVQQALEDPRTTPAQVARVIGIDAALAARILRLSNSAFLNPSGKPITELTQAVNRLGHQLVRCSAVSFALQQMRVGKAEAVLRPQLKELWRKGTLVASIAYVLARETKTGNPDEALVAGLMHNIGILYITVRAHERGEPLPPVDGGTGAVYEWHPRIASAILAHWKFAPVIVAAVAKQNVAADPAARSDRLSDVLAAATALLPCVFYRALLDETLTAVAPFRRLGLDADGCQQLLAATAQQIKSLHSALTG